MKIALLGVLSMIPVLASQKDRRRRVIHSKLCNARTCGTCVKIFDIDILHGIFQPKNERAQRLCTLLLSLDNCCGKY